MFKDHDLDYGTTSGTATLSLTDAIALPLRAHTQPSLLTRIHDALDDIDFVPDLGCDIGSRQWWRGLATLTGLCGAALWMAPGFGAMAAPVPAPMSDSDWQVARAQTIMPLAYGGDTGVSMAATDRVRPLASSPERPRIDMVATLGRGDGFERVLKRSGVGGDDASEVARLIANALPLADLESGTKVDLTLGRRPSKSVARPLDSLALRARFDLRLEIERVDGALKMRRIPIAVDDTPLRIRGRVGDSLYRSARAAGAPAKAVEAYLKVLSTRLSVGRDIRADDQFDIIVDYRRAETGEVETGDLKYAGLIREGKTDLKLMAWKLNGRQQWFDGGGKGESRAGLAAPVPGRTTSPYGMRRHPVLGYRRMHPGIDYRAAYGTPIRAVTDGRVTYAGRRGGYGNFVKLNHSGNLASGYAHMSRIAVRSGARVTRGQVIGYAGSTGLSTGSHLHFELYRNGRTVNPSSVRYEDQSRLAGADLRKFRGELDRVLRVEPGAALRPMAGTERRAQAEEREADRLPG